MSKNQQIIKAIKQRHQEKNRMYCEENEIMLLKETRVLKNYPLLDDVVKTVQKARNTKWLGVGWLNLVSKSNPEELFQVLKRKNYPGSFTASVAFCDKTKFGFLWGPLGSLEKANLDLLQKWIEENYQDDSSVHNQTTQVVLPGGVIANAI